MAALDDPADPVALRVPPAGPNADATPAVEPADPGSLAAAAAESGGLGSLASDVRTLADDAQTLVEAELAYQSARAAYVWNRGQRVLVWLLVALACGFFALVALVVGLLLALIPLLGVWAALAVVAAALALGGWLALRTAVAELRRIRSRAIAADPLVPPQGIVTPEPAGPPTPPALAEKQAP